MGPDDVTLELATVEAPRAGSSRVLVRFRVASFLGSFELEVLCGPGRDLNAAVDEARQRVQAFARRLGDEAAKPAI